VPSLAQRLQFEDHLRHSSTKFVVVELRTTSFQVRDIIGNGSGERVRIQIDGWVSQGEGLAGRENQSESIITSTIDGVRFREQTNLLWNLSTKYLHLFPSIVSSCSLVQLKSSANMLQDKLSLISTDIIERKLSTEVSL
jgi:hypothetical protein